MNKQLSHKLVFFCILFLCGLLCIYLFMHSSFFCVDKISITGAVKLSQDEVLQLAKLKKGTNIFEINRSLCSSSIEAHPLVKKASLLRHLPRGVEIIIEERQVWAIIPHQGAFLCVDPEGVCIDKTSILPDKEYCIITMDKIPDGVNLGQVVCDPAVSNIKKIWDALPEENRKYISDFHYINDKKQINIYTCRGTEIKFGDMERLEDKIAMINQLAELELDFEEKGTEVLQYVDLRFNGQPAVKTRD